MLVPQFDERPALHLQSFANEVVEMRGRQTRGIGFRGELAAVFKLRDPVAIFVPKSGDVVGMCAGLAGKTLNVSKGRFVSLSVARCALRDAIRHHLQLPGRAPGKEA